MRQSKNLNHQHLWVQLQALRISEPNAALSFEQRLARENAWSLGYAERVVLEYKRFVYLIAISGKELTPSDEVDQAWHLHLAYTHSYWKKLCAEVLGFELHHQPTQGGADQLTHFKERYQDTLNIYQQEFGMLPPADIWPKVEVRFHKPGAYQRINRQGVWLIPKPAHAVIALSFALFIPLIITACTPNIDEMDFWTWVKVAFGAWGVYIIIKLINDKLGGTRGGRGGRGSGGNNGMGCSSGCSSGCGGCGGGD